MLVDELDQRPARRKTGRGDFRMSAAYNVRACRPPRWTIAFGNGHERFVEVGEAVEQGSAALADGNDSAGQIRTQHTLHQILR